MEKSERNMENSTERTERVKAAQILRRERQSGNQRRHRLCFLSQGWETSKKSSLSRLQETLLVSD